jgi:DDE superfamily endonuclease
MEDVLDRYTAPVDPQRPLVCFDESPYQRISETRLPLPAGPGQVERYDHEYARAGVDNLFLFFAPFANWRTVQVTEQRTKRDFAFCMRDLVDVYFPDAVKIQLVLDQLNTHRLAVLYEVFAPAEAKRIIDKLEIHHTPKHGSWLNMAEIEFAVLKEQCLGRRIGERERLVAEIAAWEAERNAAGMTVNWRFTTADARIKLKRLYPLVEPDLSNYP